jgi:transposase
MTVGAEFMTKEPQVDNNENEENKRKALEALESRGSRHDAAAAADVSLKTLDDWRQRDAEFAAEWDARIDRVMTRLREHPLDDKGNFKRSPLQYGLKATEENKEIVLAMLANGATYAAAAAAVDAHRRTVMKWADADEEFALRWNDAIERASIGSNKRQSAGRATASNGLSSIWVKWSGTCRNTATVCSSSCWRPSGQRSIGRETST